MFSIPYYYSKTEEKAQHFNIYIKTKIVYQLLYCVSIIVPFRYLCYPNELFGPKKVSILLARYVDGKAGYATFKVKDAVTKKKSPSTTVTFFYHISRKTNGFPA
jgi:hypothetical protein